MDFLKLIQSLDELLYEIMSWLIFYPVTLWRALTRPLKMMDYSEAELGDPAERQYTDTLSPPLFLLLSLLLSHFLEIGLNIDPVAQANASILQMSEQNLLVFRSLVFALFPLMFALRYVKASGLSLSRTTLRAPFFIECYPASVFALLLQIGMTMERGLQHGRIAGGVLAVAATVWYLAVQTAWLSRGDKSRWKAFSIALWQLVKALAIILLVAIGLAYESHLFD